MVNRTAVNPSTNQVLDAGSNKHLRSPSVVSGGASFRPSPKLMFTGQVG
jgi:hypothetical protein